VWFNDELRLTSHFYHKEIISPNFP
jgi:hypothetical protein